MEILLEYYKLQEEKLLGDGQRISKNQKLVLLMKDDNDGMLFFETYNDDYKKLFWTRQDEVEFIGAHLENWNEEKINKRNCYINGEFL